MEEFDEHTQEENDYCDAPPPIKADEKSARLVMDFAKVRKELNQDGSTKTIIKSRKSTFVSKLLYLNGAPFSFEGRNYLMPIYDGVDKNILLKTGRQVEKTTFLGNNLVVDSAVVPYNKSLYVSPSHTQTRQFSNEKLRPAIEQSPLIKKFLQNHTVSCQVMEKGFTNGAYIFLRSAFRSADRTRGISARNLFLDEVQDFIGSEIPVIMECTSHFEDSRILMAGTPKSFDNPIEDYWQGSTQCEWLVPCNNCNPRYWNFLDEKNIAPTDLYLTNKLPPGPVCKRCMHPIDPTTGQWMTMSPGKRIKGYRISQLQVCWITKTYDQWLKLLWKRDNYPFGQFYNEVLGLSFDNASKPISRDELIECCDNSHQMLAEFPNAEQAAWGRGRTLIGGVDWGEGNDGSDKSPTGKIRHASYTVFTVGTYIDQKRFKVMYVKKYTGQQTDPDFVVRDIARFCGAYDVKLVGVDWGHGWGVNNQLVRMLGPSRVIQFQYMPKMKHKMKWDPVGFRYQLQRNLIISELFLMLKEKRVVFPAWKVIEPFARDILAVFVEYVEYRREMKYDHKTSEPDDFLHSLNYCVLSANIYLGKVPRV